MAILVVAFTISEIREDKKFYFSGLKFRFSFMVFNTTCNNISIISWRSVLLVEETGENL